MEAGAAVETVEQMGNLILCDTRAVIQDTDADKHGVFFNTDRDAAPGRSIFDRIVDDIIDKGKAEIYGSSD